MKTSDDFTKEHKQYVARLRNDEAIRDKIEYDLEVMVYSLIGEMPLNIELNNNSGFDTYPSCKHWEKEYCPCKNKKFRASLPDHALVWFGDSKAEIYCKIIASFMNKVYFPFSVLPRHIEETEDV